MGGAICCAGSACCSCLCGVCMKCCGTSHQQHTRIGYLTITIVAIFFGLIFLYFGQDMMSPWESFGFDCHGDTKSICLGVFTIYRESFTLVVFYFLMILGSLPGGRASLGFNQSCWSMKILFIITMFIVTFFIPNSFFEVFREICRYVSIVYLLVQIIVIIDFGYSWSENWTERSESMLTWLFIASGFFWVISLLLISLNYYWFARNDGCDKEIILITFTLVLGIAFTILSISSWAEHGSLLTSSVVNCYCTYLCWDGLTNDTNKTCNTWDNGKDTGVIISFATFVLIITLAYVCFRKREKITDQAPIRGAAEPILADEDNGEEGQAYKDEEDHVDEGYGRKMLFFHLFMLLASFYFSMLLTNWGAANINNDDNDSYQNKEGSLWVKFSAQWITIVLYVWSLIAAKVCSSRDFS